jgi:hypothetical protein
LARLFGVTIAEVAMASTERSTSPPLEVVTHGALVFLCPSCECELEYVGSHPRAGSDAASDLTDRFRCPAGCGTFEHDRERHRFRLLEPGFLVHR